MKIINNTMSSSLNEIVLFPFDDYALPLQRGVQLNLKSYQGGSDRTQIILAPGDKGTHDSEHIAYYGTVKKVGDEYWMWYLGQGPVQMEDESTPWFQRVCLAKSKDGYNWKRPMLGLVEYSGSRANNLVDMGPDIGHVSACVVFYEPDEPAPDRRFKMAFADRRYHNQLAVAFSADGLSWTESSTNPVGPWFEMAGGTRVDDAYFLVGQGGMHIKDAARQFAVHTSYDFENWCPASTLGMQRSNSTPATDRFSKNGSAQIHLGAGLWNRGNVIIGFYGMWNGHSSNDRRMVNIDLGIVVSHDAQHYREPIANFPMVSAAEDSWKPLPDGPDLKKFPAIMQGQGFENIGDETLFWYAPWPEQKSDGVRVAVWPRDRLGYFQAYSHGPLHPDDTEPPHVISAPIDLEGQTARLCLNLDKPHEHCGISAEILDERFTPIQGHTRTDCLPMTKAGLSEPVSWKSTDIISHKGGRIRIRINFTGVRFEDLHLYAVYLQAIT